ncbi:MAG: hypothetical protein K2X03_06190 [Bryobacteraceae bacterium]|nr:hypothetical protein [Bryobacteraceae bacterium]
MLPLTRRTLLAVSASAFANAQTAFDAFEADVVRRTDDGIEAWMAHQNLDPKSRHYGGYADAHGFYNGGSVTNAFEILMPCYLHPQSRFYQSPLLMERMKLCEIFLRNHTSAEGNIDLWITNFNSAPDTSFAVHSACRAALLAKRHNAPELTALVEPFLKRSTPALLTGGIHTPNHRWEMCAALASLHELYPNPALVKRVDQWLAEGIDLDSDGQYTERSSVVYNSVVNQALTVVAMKLNRPALLDPVRRNIDAVLYLLHGSLEQKYEVETGISRRQDANTRGGLARYWHPLAVLAQRDNNAVYRGLARYYAPFAVGLCQLMLEPDLLKLAGPEAPVPDNYEKIFPRMGVARVRRGLTSATIYTQDKSSFFSLRRGDAVIHSVRFATGFFGKGQFRAHTFTRRDGAFVLSQALEGPYYQPFSPGRRVDMTFDETREQRPKSLIAKLNQSAEIRETAKGFDLRIQAAGTNDVPLTIEINCREDATLDGVDQVSPDVYRPTRGASRISISRGAQAIRVAPLPVAHDWYDVRGAESKLPGPSIYLTGLTPFDVTLHFEVS